MSRITVLGLGAMGSRMAARLAGTGHEVTAWNRSPGAVARLAAETAVTAAPSARAAVAEAEIVLAMVADDEASRDLWLDADRGALVAVPDHAVAIEASTLTPAWVRELADATARRGLAFVEAPVVGSRPQVEAGALLVLAGGEAEVVERARPALDAFAGSIREVGPAGAAATLKLAINALFATQVAVYAEIVGLLDRSEVDTGLALDVLADLPITSPGLQRIVGLIRARDFAPNFPVPLVAKDLRYLTALAGQLDADTPVAAAALEVFTSAAADDRAELDIAGIATGYLDG